MRPLSKKRQPGRTRQQPDGSYARYSHKEDGILQTECFQLNLYSFFLLHCELNFTSHFRFYPLPSMHKLHRCRSRALPVAGEHEQAFPNGLRGFTPTLRREGQFQLDFPLLTIHETCVLLAAPFNSLRGPFGPSAFGLLCPLLTSAPRSGNLAVSSVPIAGHGADLSR